MVKFEEGVPDTIYDKDGDNTFHGALNRALYRFVDQDKASISESDDEPLRELSGIDAELLHDVEDSASSDGVNYLIEPVKLLAKRELQSVVWERRATCYTLMVFHYVYIHLKFTLYVEWQSFSQV